MTNTEDIRDAIKAAHAQKVAESELWYPYCFASHNTVNTLFNMRALGYTNDELNRVPLESLMGLGCCNLIPFAGIKLGDKVLDIGSGSGTDVFLAAQQVGHKGMVVGIDMTNETVQKSKVIASHYGYKNVEFHTGYIENLPFSDDNFNIIISNFAISFSPDKDLVFSEAYRVLGSHGRMVIADRALKHNYPFHISDSPESWARGLGGLINENEYVEKIQLAGFIDVNIMSRKDAFNVDENHNNEKIHTIVITAEK